MAHELRSPGVYVEEVRPPRTIEPVATATTLFLGHARQGPTDRAVRLTSFGEYDRTFGSIAGLDHLGYAVRGFFANGGRMAVVRRLSAAGASSAPVRDPAAFALALDDPDPDVAAAAVVVTPGVAWDAEGRPVLEAVIAACETGRRIALVDPPQDADLARAAGVAALALPVTSHAALYHPWLVVAAASGVSGPGWPGTVVVPPSGSIAGLYARTDLERGVWMAPAGTAAILHGVEALAHAGGERRPARRAPSRVNAIRRLPGGAPVAWGARTLAGDESPEWKYVNVRRLALMIERSIDQGTRWAVFEPNDEPLWAALRDAVGAFLYGLWHAGAFRGQRTSEAFAVRCGLGSTMTQADLDRGLLVLEVMIAPLRPAEFIVLRYRMQTGAAA